MGHEAAVTKKRVLGKVEDCVAAVNEMIAAVETLEQQHNALCADLTAKHNDYGARLAAHGTWCEDNEKSIRALTADLAALVSTHAALDKSTTTAIELLARGLIDLRGTVTAQQVDADAFAALGFGGRLRWLLTGQRPRHRSEVPYAEVATPVTGGARAASSASVDPQTVASPAGAFTL